MININKRKFNVFTILALLALISGILFYIYWGISYSVWYDPGIYSITIVFVLSGLIGILLTLYEKPEGKN
jgi:hypothetical protein